MLFDQNPVQPSPSRVVSCFINGNHDDRPRYFDTRHVPEPKMTSATSCPDVLLDGDIHNWISETVSAMRISTAPREEPCSMAYTLGQASPDDYLLSDLDDGAPPGVATVLLWGPHLLLAGPPTQQAGSSAATLPPDILMGLL